jgi:hypothetical protein
VEVARGPYCWLVAERDSYELLVGQTPARRTAGCSTGALNAGSEPRTQAEGEANVLPADPAAEEGTRKAVGK